MKKLSILKPSLESRNDEILNYQINIDNYERAIAKIESSYSDNPAMIEFRDQLAHLLESNKTEQLKSIIIRDVIAEQISEIENSEEQ